MIDQRLRVLRMVSATGSVRAAADALNCTSSAVSRQVRSLADDLGVELFAPHGRGVCLTAAARILLEHADDLFAQWEATRAKLAATQTGDGRELSLCGFSTAAAEVLPRLAVRLRAARPKLVTHIVEAAPRECFQLLMTGEADIAFVVGCDELPATDDPRFEQRPLFDEPLDLLISTSHRLAHASEVDLAELGDESWIAERSGRPGRTILEDACAEAGFVPVVAHHATEWTTAVALVAADLGIALVPRLAPVPRDYPALRVPFTEQLAPSRPVLVAMRRGSIRHPGIAMALEAFEGLTCSPTAELSFTVPCDQRTADQ